MLKNALGNGLRVSAQRYYLFGRPMKLVLATVLRRTWWPVRRILAILSDLAVVSGLK